MDKANNDKVDFISNSRIDDLLNQAPPDKYQVHDIIQKSLSKTPLSLSETTELLLVKDPDLSEEILNAARQLKQTVYGNRIVIFAPLYIGNDCINDCSYCSFGKSNAEIIRKTLNNNELRNQIESLEDRGHKRLILVFGEHPKYNSEFIANTVKQAYSIKKGLGEIRRVNINAAPLSLKGFQEVKKSGIGTYQIFQETYHRHTYAKYHPHNTPKSNYDYRLHSLSRAMKAGIDDVGIGALFGLYDWRYEVLGLVAHSIHLREHFNVGPHTVSFPRIRKACNINLSSEYLVSDDDFISLIATIRLAIPYTGMILTARETPDVRRRVLEFGVSQIDAGSRIEIGGYGKGTCNLDQHLEKEQFELGDMRPLDDIILELLQKKFLPSFCTACYRLGRTGEHFMEYAIPGFINKFCTPNALLTLMEYLTDYGSTKTVAEGLKLINSEMNNIEDKNFKNKVAEDLIKISTNKSRDIYY